MGVLSRRRTSRNKVFPVLCLEMFTIIRNMDYIRPVSTIHAGCTYFDGSLDMGYVLFLSERCVCTGVRKVTVLFYSMKNLLSNFCEFDHFRFAQ